MTKYTASVDLSLLQHWVQGSLLLTTINNSSRIIFYANKIFTMISLHIKDLCVIKLFMARKQWVKSRQLASRVRRNCRCISGCVWTFDHYSVSMQCKNHPPAYLVIFSHITHSWLFNKTLQGMRSKQSYRGRITPLGNKYSNITANRPFHER